VKAVLENMDRIGLEWARYRHGWKLPLKNCGPLNEMERTGRRPDLLAAIKKAGRIHFYTIVGGKSKGRRSLLLRREALESRKRT